LLQKDIVIIVNSGSIKLHVMATVFIETPRLILRQWQESDHEPYIQLNADSAVMEFFPSVLTRDQTLAQIKRIADAIAGNGYGFFAVERKDTHEFIGFTGLSNPGFESHFTPCVEIGWRLSKANWNQGFATEAAGASLEFGFNTFGLAEIFSFTSVYNLRSEKVMKSIGMTHAGFFEHPLIEQGNNLKTHTIYKIMRDNV
jgi:RimJ/RimL family protein N-acetyltransferase